ncbi:MAG: B12-binding domain-containing protein [Planctomycetaceae bacterium]|nr:B12-binding domain-containing protein [Planctomycetaceae bacterium]
MKELVSPRQVAQAIDVSESSLKRWCDQGKILTVRTAGGHRRIPVNAALSFLRDAGYQIVHPEILGLPASTTGGHTRKLCSERERLLTALLEGNESVCTEVVLNLYLARIPLSQICDEVLASAFGEIGEKWGCGDVAVYQERRSCELCHRVLYEVRRALPEVLVNAPMAVGGTVDGDPYTLASSMAELVLRESGWRAASLGNMLPFSTLRQALCDMRPRLFWLSVSAIRDQAAFLSEFEKLSTMGEENGVAIVIGGKALTEEIRRRMRYHCFCDTFTHLETFANGLLPRPRGREEISATSDSA